MMRLHASLLLPLVVLCPSTIPGQIPAGQRIGLAQYLQVSYAGLKRDLTEAAQKMPEADYGYKPGTMPEVRTYGQVIAHVAAGHFAICASVKGITNPSQGKDLEHASTTKAEFIRALADSFAFCDDVFSTLTDASLSDFIKQGQGEVQRSAAVLGLIAHDAEMYGISTVYLRAKNIVPPSTERSRGRGGR